MRRRGISAVPLRRAGPAEGGPHSALRISGAHDYRPEHNPDIRLEDHDASRSGQHKFKTMMLLYDFVP